MSDNVFQNYLTRYSGDPAKIHRVRPKTFKILDKDRATVAFFDTCTRCGGTGVYIDYGTCFKCGGHCGQWAQAKLYTPEKIEQLNAAKDKRDAKKAAKWEAEQAERKAYEDRNADANIKLNRDAYPRMGELIDYKGDVEFVKDIASKIRLHPLSEAQVEAALKAIDRELKDAYERDNAEPIVEGRYEIEGEILTVKHYEGQFGTVTKILVKKDDGGKVFGSVPSKLYDLVAEVATDEDRGLKGRRVAFTAAITPSDDDPLFGFYKRPTKPRLVTGE